MVNHTLPGTKDMTFRALHTAAQSNARAFVIPNPWDIGSARMLASLGFPALATTSAGMAFALGIREGTATPDQTLAHCRHIVLATDLPVNADLESGFGHTPESAALTIRQAAETGIAGGSLEDVSGDPANPIYDITLATEKIAAAAEAARALPRDFVLTARAENFLHGRPDLDDTIRRLQAFEGAGADVLYAPGLPSLDAIRTLCASVTKPVNVVMGMPGRTWSVAELSDAGVARISVGSALARLAYGHLIRAGQSIATNGTFGFTDDAMGFAEIEGYLSDHRPDQ